MQLGSTAQKSTTLATVAVPGAEAPIRATEVDGKVREVMAVDRRTMIMWLATISSGKVAEEIRPTLEAFQNESDRPLLDAAYARRFTKAVQA